MRAILVRQLTLVLLASMRRELYRELGLDEAIRDAYLGINLSKSFDRRTLHVEIIDAHKRSIEGNKNISTSGQAFIRTTTPAVVTWETQDLVELPLLTVVSAQKFMEMRFRTQYASFYQNEVGVPTVVRNRKTGEMSAIETHYSQGANGAYSSVIKMTREGVLGHLLNILPETDTTISCRDLSLASC